MYINLADNSVGLLCKDTCMWGSMHEQRGFLWRLLSTRADLHPTSSGGQTQIVGPERSSEVLRHDTTRGRYPSVCWVVNPT